MPTLDLPITYTVTANGVEITSIPEEVKEEMFSFFLNDLKIPNLNIGDTNDDGKMVDYNFVFKVISKVKTAGRKNKTRRNRRRRT